MSEQKIVFWLLGITNKWVNFNFQFRIQMLPLEKLMTGF